MAESYSWLDALGSSPDFVERVNSLIELDYSLRARLLQKHPNLVPGVRDHRLRAESVRIVSKGEEGGGERVPVDLNRDLLIETSMMTWAHCWGVEAIYARIRQEISGAFPTFTESDRLDAMLHFVPHTVHLVTVILHEGKVLMRLEESGTSVKPASVIGFPHAVQMGHYDSIDDASLVLARSAFAPFPRAGWRVDLDPTWGIVFPDRPEVVLIRYAEFVGDPSIFFGVWMEELCYPFVWVDVETLTLAMKGDTSSLIEEVRVADKRYRARARNMVTEIVIHESCSECRRSLRSGSRKVPDKSCLTVSDTLSLDETSRDVLLSFGTL